jgi:putative transposase
MARSNRLIAPDSAFHIISRGNNKQNVFHSERDKFYYFRLLLDLKEDAGIDIFHYCLMNNHVHLIIWLTMQSELPNFMKRLNLRYYAYYQKCYGHSGHLWQSRYKSYFIDKESYLLQCGKYIELNPVRAGLVRSPEQYRFSSYRYYALGDVDLLLTPNPVYIGLSQSVEIRKKRYLEFVVA